MDENVQLRAALGNIVAVVLGVASAVVFAQMLMQGELTKAIVLFYQQQHVDVPLMYPGIVSEMHVIEMEFIKVSLHLIAGVMMILLSTALKYWIPDTQKLSIVTAARTRNDTVLFVLTALGLILWDAGYLIIGYDKPRWELFFTVSLVMIGFGGGMFIWGSFILLMHRISEIRNSSSWVQRLILAIFVTGPPMYILFFFIHLHYLAYDVEVEGEKFQFYLTYRTIGTIMAPVVVFVVFACFLDACTFGCSCVPEEKVEEAEVEMPKAEMLEVEKMEWTARFWISLVSFYISKMLFAPVFFGTAILFFNWIHHVGGPSAFSISNINGTGFNNQSSTGTLESTVIQTSMMLMALGMLVGRFMLVFAVDFPRLRPSKGVSAPVQVGWSMFIRLLAHLFSFAGTIWWHERTKYTAGRYDTGSVYALAFLLGFGNGSIFTDTFISILLYFKMNLKTMQDAYYDDLRLAFAVFSFIPITLVCTQFSTGAFGALGPANDKFIDYVQFTLLLSCLIGVATLFDLVSFIAHPSVMGTCCGKDASKVMGARLKELGGAMMKDEALHD